MSPYYTNELIRELIDGFLKKNAKLQASLGTDSTDEQKFRVKMVWETDLLLEIYKLDPEFAEKLHAQDD
tara:strand:- start:2273 stop:2479 length:207 start_codon:yes stop_codon:yes gene_type:complete